MITIIIKLNIRLVFVNTLPFSGRAFVRNVVGFRVYLHASINYSNNDRVIYRDYYYVSWAFPQTLALCAMAVALPASSLAAEDTVVIKASQADTADAPTQGYSAKTSKKARLNRPAADHHRSGRFGRNPSADGSECDDSQRSVLNYTPGVFTNFVALLRYDTISCVASTAATSTTLSLMACVF